MDYYFDELKPSRANELAQAKAQEITKSLSDITLMDDSLPAQTSAPSSQ